MWHVALIDNGGSGWKLDFFAVGGHEGSPLNYVDRFFAVMGMAGNGLTGLKLNRHDDHLHTRAGQVAPFQFGPGLSQSVGGEGNQEHSTQSKHFHPHLLFENTSYYPSGTVGDQV